MQILYSLFSKCWKLVIHREDENGHFLNYMLESPFLLEIVPVFPI